MSLSISGIGAVQPIYTPPQAPAPYASNTQATDSVAATTAGTETGAASVVYEPGSSDAAEQYTYGQTGAAPKPANDTQPFALAGDATVVEATGSAASPPPEMTETPIEAEVKEALTNVWAPMKPIATDPASADVGGSVAPAQAGQAEASAQATYTAIADAQVAGASASDVKKYA